MESGVYIISNPAMPGLLKIGKTTKGMQRIKDLSNHSGIPSAFKLEHWQATAEPTKVERQAHVSLDSKRYNQNREFFRCSVSEAIKAVGGTIETQSQTKDYVYNKVSPKVQVTKTAPKYKVPTEEQINKEVEQLKANIRETEAEKRKRQKETRRVQKQLDYWERNKGFYENPIIRFISNIFY